MGPAAHQRRAGRFFISLREGGKALKVFTTNALQKFLVDFKEGMTHGNQG